MKRLMTLAALIVVFTTGASAQSDEYKRFEFFGGYSALHMDNLAGDTSNPDVDAVLGDRQTLRGFNLAAGWNFHKYVGAKFDYSLHLREDEFTRPAGSGTIDSTLQNFLGGIQVKNNSEDGPRFKPFAHALFGVAVQKLDVDSPQLQTIFGISDFHTNETSFAMAFGGWSRHQAEQHLRYTSCSNRLEHHQSWRSANWNRAQANAVSNGRDTFRDTGHARITCV